MSVKTYFRVPIKRALKLIHKTKAKVLYPPKEQTDFLKHHWTAQKENLRLYLSERPDSKSFYHHSRQENIREYYKQNPKGQEMTISTADKILRHTISLLGKEDIKLGDQINWHKDYITDFQWDPKLFYTDVQIPYDQADIKFPWELSRCHHLITLGQAYCLSGDEKYTEEFMRQVSGWIDQNPCQHGVNWHCTMDVALRAANWSAALAFFLPSTLLDDAFLTKFLNSIYHHGRHIRSNLEYNPVATGNHYLSNLLGLIYIGCYFPEFKKSGEWKQFAIQEMKREMVKQVYPDGTHYEASTCYHRLVLEIFFYSSLIAIINHPDFQSGHFRETGNRIFGKEYMNRLRTMFLALAYLLKPNGYMPQIGDNDNGQVHQWAHRDTLDMRYLLCLGVLFFDDPELKIGDFGFAEDCLWVYPPATYRAWDALEGQKLDAIQSKAFPDSGWYVMRHNKDYMIISCGPNGKKGEGTHAHNDKLSFELMINGTDQIVDPGTFAYTGDTKLRNRSRSTALHNTLTVNGKEQNPIPNDLWRLPDTAKAAALKWESASDMDILAASHQGFGIDHVHERTIIFHKIQKPYWQIVDRLAGSGEHTISWNLNLAQTEKPKISLKSEKILWKQQPGQYAPAYGKRLNIVRQQATLQTILPAEFDFTIQEGIPECD